MKISDCLGQRVLVGVNDDPPRMTSVVAFSGTEQYVWLTQASTFDEDIGWRHVSYVRVLESFGPSSAVTSVAALLQSLQQVSSST